MWLYYMKDKRGGGELSQVQVPNEQARESREAIW